MLIPYKLCLKDEACLRYKQKFGAGINWPVEDTNENLLTHLTFCILQPLVFEYALYK
jgi:hypothetical protein